MTGHLLTLKPTHSEPSNNLFSKMASKIFGGKHPFAPKIMKAAAANYSSKLQPPSAAAGNKRTHRFYGGEEPKNPEL